MRDTLGLSGDGYAIVEMAKGTQALELIAAERPDLVLLDIAMPELGGIPVCAEIKRNLVSAHVRVVVVSAHASEEFIATCLAEGASDYIVKPFHPCDLLRRVRQALAAPALA